VGWFDPPAIALRKRLPPGALAGFNVTEEFALHHLGAELEQHRPYQLGIVLALWIKAGELVGEITLSHRDSRKVQAIYESCMKVLRGDSYTAFCVLAELAEQDHMFGMSANFYRQLSINVAGAI
jgi:hypothetical protein